ncbi:hypothetical protein [Planosporangium mesophilum]|uniref:Uncharacterized protein n=1 Tax=Planosporangium mesophilum TaxID=689768 RepID=A0A8J3T900_9ACTN|nr:hypothetical protein [Planosporangium mesophilum]NJC83517.1 hypothetical protein [Planosporangium mesophilum]GII22028.1 hypothetical protein Pme01_16250 [Planosporangium mesophilum]
MKPWETMRREVLGAWRSIRYDLDRRPGADGEPDAAAHRDRPGDGASLDLRPRPVTTADEDWYSEPLPERVSIWAPLKDPRRVLATGAVASVIAASATGTFFAVTGGLGILLADANAGVPVPERAPATATQAGASSPASRQHRAAPPARPQAAVASRPSATPAARPAGPAEPVPSVVVTTSPPSRSPVPEATPSASTSHSASPSAAPSASPTP